MKETAFETAKAWASNNYLSESDRASIQSMLNASDRENELIESFYKNLEFGTGGLRSQIGLGSNRINKYNVRRAAQAMANIALKENKMNARACVSFDCRQFSDTFAKEVASVFAANGIKTYIFHELTPTPMLSYAIRYYDAHCGVMITASHNPKEYNGFKAYWSDGAQVTPPQDQMIIDQYNNLKDWSEIKYMNFDEAMSKELIAWVGEECNESFYQILEKVSLNRKMCQEQGDQLHVIYTPLHGTGYRPCEMISQRLGFTHFEIVKEQATFDSAFSTVRTTPNPEDPAALEMGVDRMLKKKADLCYGTDPDCDRLGVVVNDHGKPYYLNGNQIAVLLVHYMLEQSKAQGTLPKNPLIIKSIVTSDLQKTIGDAFGATTLNTLTGFKWMAKLWKELEDKGTDYNFFFASEESFGYMTHNQCRDKDAVGAVAMMNEVALYHKLADRNLVEALDKIYTEFGYAQESLVSLTFEGISGQQKIDRIMRYFRENHQEIAGNKIVEFEDFESLINLNLKTGKREKIEMVSSNVLGFTFADGTRLFTRPSGTEPKIKFYTMVQVKEGSLEEKKKVASQIITKVENFIKQKVDEI